MANRLMKLYVRFQKVKIFNRGLKYSWRWYWNNILQFLAHSTPLKVVNYLFTKAQKWLKRDNVIGMPYHYVIDALNICNLHCPLCPTGLGTIGRSRGKIDYEKYAQLIDQIVPYAYMVELYNWGEPFLHPRIFDLIHYASSRRIEVRLSSNMNHFNAEMARKAVESGLDAINVSVDGIDQETYEKYRRGGKLSKVLDNIRLLVEAKRQLRSRTPFITLRFLITRYNENQIDDMRKLSDELGVDCFNTAPIYIDTTNPAQVEEWLPVENQYSYYDRSAEKLENVWACADLWESMTINWDGGLAPCCWLHQKDHDYENAFERPLKDIWNGEAYISSRRVFAFGGAKAGPIQTICTTCKGKPLYLKD